MTASESFRKLTFMSSFVIAIAFISISLWEGHTREQTYTIKKHRHLRTHVASMVHVTEQRQQDIKTCQFYIILNEKPATKIRKIDSTCREKTKGFKNCAWSDYGTTLRWLTYVEENKKVRSLEYRRLFCSICTMTMVVWIYLLMAEKF